MYVPPQISSFPYPDRVSFKPGEPGSCTRSSIHIILNSPYPLRLFQRLCRPTQEPADICPRSLHQRIPSSPGSFLAEHLSPLSFVSLCVVALSIRLFHRFIDNGHPPRIPRRRLRYSMEAQIVPPNRRFNTTGLLPQVKKHERRRSYPTPFTPWFPN